MSVRFTGLDWHDAGPYPNLFVPSLGKPQLHSLAGTLYLTGLVPVHGYPALHAYRVSGVRQSAPQPQFTRLASHGDALPAFADCSCVAAAGAVWALLHGSWEDCGGSAGPVTSPCRGVYRGVPKAEGLQWSHMPPRRARVQGLLSPEPAGRSLRVLACTEGLVVAWAAHHASPPPGTVHVLCLDTIQWTACSLPADAPPLTQLCSVQRTVYTLHDGAVHALELQLDPEGPEGVGVALLRPLVLQGPPPLIRSPNVFAYGPWLFVFRGRVLWIDVRAGTSTDLISPKRRGCKDVSCDEFQSLAVCGGRAYATTWSSDHAEDVLLYAELPSRPWSPQGHAEAHPAFQRVARTLCRAVLAAGLFDEVAPLVLKYLPWALWDVDPDPPTARSQTPRIGSPGMPSVIPTMVGITPTRMGICHTASPAAPDS